MQQLAVIVEELSRKVLLCTQPEFFRTLLVHNSNVFEGSPKVFMDIFLQDIPQIFENFEIGGLCRQTFHYSEPIFPEINFGLNRSMARCLVGTVQADKGNL